MFPNRTTIIESWCNYMKKEREREKKEKIFNLTFIFTNVS